MQETFTARDGAKLACWRGGEGPPLLLVHGSISDRSVWDPIRPRLEEQFTVHVLNRRGREGSAPLLGGDLRREFEDVGAAIDHIGEAPHVLGHSFGAICAAGAAHRGAQVRSLALYEPPALAEEVSEMARALQGVLEDQGPEPALRVFLAAGPGETPETIERLAASPLWSTLQSLIPTTPLELQAMATPSAIDAERFRSLDVPVLYVLGTQSPAHFRAWRERLAPVLSDLRTVELEGEGHFANVLSPERFADTVLRFLGEAQAG